MHFRLQLFVYAFAVFALQSMTAVAQQATITNAAIPDGYTNPESVTIELLGNEGTYTIPENRHLYITRIEIIQGTVTHREASINIGEKRLFKFSRGNILCDQTDVNFSVPIILGGGSVLSLQGRNEHVHIEGFLTDAIVETVLLFDDDTYTVPAGKTFVAMHEISHQKCEKAYLGSFDYDSFDTAYRTFPVFYKAGAVVKSGKRERLMIGYVY